jgi:hypothetical protein
MRTVDKIHPAGGYMTVLGVLVIIGASAILALRARSNLT